jgi:hypothetical protein
MKGDLNDYLTVLNQSSSLCQQMFKNTTCNFENPFCYFHFSLDLNPRSLVYMCSAESFQMPNYNKKVSFIIVFSPYLIFSSHVCIDIRVRMRT